jgi:hypothetical protein
VRDKSWVIFDSGCTSGEGMCYQCLHSPHVKERIVTGYEGTRTITLPKPFLRMIFLFANLPEISELDRTETGVSMMLLLCPSTVSFPLEK